MVWKWERISRRGWAGFLAVGTIVTGLVWRMAPLHLPGFAYKYGGTALYGAMLYWLLVMAFPRRQVAPAALAMAFAVEAFKLVHWPALDAFRTTLAGKLLLGRVFTVGALVAYAAAILMVSALDRWFTGRLLKR